MQRGSASTGCVMGHWNPTPYEQRSDIDKIQSQWTKLNGHQNRTDWSAAVVRAATACEIAVNLAIRREFSDRSAFGAEFVDSLLLWSNGLAGKVSKLLLPMLQGEGRQDVIKELCKLADRINGKRNMIAHRGEFCSEQESTELISQCEKFVVGLVKLYQPDFELRCVASKRDVGARA